MTTQNQINTPVPFPIAKGGTGVTSVTTAPSASAWAGWDANSNLSANNFLPGYATTTTAAGTTTLTVASAYQQFFTGSTTQTVLLPVVSTLQLGFPFYIINNSTGIVTVQSSGGNTIQAMAPGTSLYLTCILITGTAASSWNAEYAFDGGEGSGTVNLGNGNDLAFYATTGTAVSALATANSSILVTSNTGVPSLSTTLPAFTMAGNITMGAHSIQFSSGNGITDGNNNGMLAFNTTASAVNFFTMANAATNGSPIIGVTGSDTNIILTLIGKGTGGVEIQGSTAIGNGGAGYIGEVMVSSVTVSPGVSLTTNTAADVTTLSLTAGDWDIWGNVGFTGATGTSITELIAWSSSSSAALPAASLRSDHLMSAFVLGGSTFNFTIPSTRVNISSPATYYLSARATFTVSTLTACGNIYARRAR